MAETTGIAWCDSTWNPWRGCQRVSEGCQHCYAETLAKRNPAVLGTWGPVETGVRVVGAEADWKRPATWNNKARTKRPWRVFCASLADVFEDWRGPMTHTDGPALFLQPDGRQPPWVPVPGAWDGRNRLTMDHVRARVFRTMESCLNLTWLVLTKRPQNVLRMVPPAWREKWPTHVWIGATAESQPRFDERFEHLKQIPAAVRFFSVEPQLGPIDMDLDRYESPGLFEYRKNLIHWVITGGESGHGARPYDLAWARSLRDQCKASGAAFFCKQLGALVEAREGIDPIDQFPGDVTFRQGKDEFTALVVLKDRAGANPAEWPADLRVQEFPGVRA